MSRRPSSWPGGADGAVSDDRVSSLDPADAGDSRQPMVRIIRSTRRTRAISGRMVGRVVEVRVPASMSPEDEASAVRRITERVLRKSQVRPDDDADLLRRARALSREYLGVANPPIVSAHYVAMETRWGSSTPRDGTIRIALRLRSLPSWVEDYVIVHELAHLVAPAYGHGERFWRLVGRYPRTERARGYLEAVIAYEGKGQEGCPVRPGPHDETDLMLEGMPV